MSTALILTSLGGALAQEQTLAIPAGKEPTHSVSAQVSDSDFKAIQQFRSEHLEIRTITNWRGGGATVVHHGWWGPRYGPHVGIGTVYRQPVVAEHTYAVFQGPTRLNVPQYLDVVGDPREDDWRRRIDNNRRWSAGFTGLGVMGGVATIVGVIGGSMNRDFDRRDDWDLVTLSGIGGLVIGFGGASATSSRAFTLQTNYNLLGWDNTRNQVDDYNDALRQDLGISPQQAWDIIDSSSQRRGR